MIVHEFYIYCSKYSLLNKKMKNLSTERSLRHSRKNQPVTVSLNFGTFDNMYVNKNSRDFFRSMAHCATIRLAFRLETKKATGMKSDFFRLARHSFVENHN